MPSNGSQCQIVPVRTNQCQPKCSSTQLLFRDVCRHRHNRGTDHFFFAGDGCGDGAFPPFFGDGLGVGLRTLLADALPRLCLLGALRFPPRAPLCSGEWLGQAGNSISFSIHSNTCIRLYQQRDSMQQQNATGAVWETAAPHKALAHRSRAEISPAPMVEFPSANPPVQ